MRRAAKTVVFSSKFACPVSGFTIDEIEPRLFSFNNPHGACPACDGLGEKLYFDPDLVVPDKTACLADEAIAPWKTFYMQSAGGHVRSLQTKHDRTPWNALAEEFRHALLYGSGDRKSLFSPIKEG